MNYLRYIITLLAFCALPLTTGCPSPDVNITVTPGADTVPDPTEPPIAGMDQEPPPPDVAPARFGTAVFDEAVFAP